MVGGARPDHVVGRLQSDVDKLGGGPDDALLGLRAWTAGFWALSTVGGAFVVLLFGALFAAAGALLAAGLGAAIFSERLAQLQGPAMLADWLAAMPAWPPLVLASLGLLGLVALTLTVRWLVGQYFDSAAFKAKTKNTQRDYLVSSRQVLAAPMKGAVTRPGK